VEVRHSFAGEVINTALHSVSHLRDDNRKACSTRSQLFDGYVVAEGGYGNHLEIPVRAAHPKAPEPQVELAQPVAKKWPCSRKDAAPSKPRVGIGMASWP
jgi:hypothetical protein